MVVVHFIIYVELHKVSSEARRNSVDQLSRLYTVVIGIALTLAMRATLTPDASWPLVRPDCALNFLTFLVLIVPFYHGATRHLFATYIESGGSTRVKSIALFIDFFVLFIEGCLFVTMSGVVVEVSKLIWIAMSVLLLDSFWGLLASFAFTGAQAQRSERVWAYINIGTCAILGLLLVFEGDKFAMNNVPGQLLLFGVLLARTVIDYGTCWKFYFPPD